MPRERALGGGAVVADDRVDQRVVEDLQVSERVEEPADVMIGVLHEPGVDLHLPGEDRLEVVGHVVPGRDLVRACRQLGVGGDDAELLLPGERAVPQGVPAVIERALVLVRPLGRDMVRGMRRARARSR